jgi:hypothetical protein
MTIATATQAVTEAVSGQTAKFGYGSMGRAMLTVVVMSIVTGVGLAHTAGVICFTPSINPPCHTDPKILFAFVRVSWFDFLIGGINASIAKGLIDIAWIKFFKGEK